jgi:oxygen-dependent protoporphyrinogen oxidase
MERDFGSLIMGTIRRKVEKPDPNFPRTFSFKGGLKTLINSLAAEAGDDLRLGAAVGSITDGFNVNGEEFDAVVISTPSYVAADLIERRDAALAETLRAVRYPQVAVVVLGFETKQIKMDLDGFGFLIASGEKRPILGTLFHSAVFPERAPDGMQLLMTFVGGVRSGDKLDSLSDDEMTATVVAQLKDIIGAEGRPKFVHIKRWKRAIPQYRVGYEDVTAAIAAFERENPGIFFCSNFYRGVSMSDCVKNAFETADAIAATKTK